MAGTIVTDRIESDASYASSINIASPMVVSNTLTMGSAAAITGNVNIDSGTLFVDSVGNKVGIGTTTPNYELNIRKAGQTNFSLYNSSNAVELRLISDSAGAYVQTNTNHPLWFATNNGAVRMAIDTSGRVTMPYQPYFNADRSGNQTGFNAASTGDVVVVYNSTTDNLGNHFNTSTGKFTAPVAGVYAFQAGAYLNFNASQSWLVINGNRAGYADWSFGVSGAFGIGFWVVKLAANDSVGYHPYSASETSGTIYANANHTYFRGYLLS